MKREFGELRRVNLRAIWENEATDFTPWLAENLLDLGRSIGMELEFLESEGQVGGFSVDLVAKDLSSDSYVVIENQLARTDHDHLGKLITYAAGFDAYAIIWVAEEIRDEHREALDWLNERTDTDTLFFAIEIEVLQIGDSDPAYNFKGVVLPNDWQKIQHRETRVNSSPRGIAYQRFYQPILDALNEGHHFGRKRTAHPQNYCIFHSGYTSAYYGITFRREGTACVELWLKKRAIYEELDHQRAKVEANIDAELEWEPGEDGGAIATRRPGTIEDSPEKLEEIRDWMFETLMDFKQTFDPILASIV